MSRGRSGAGGGGGASQESPGDGTDARSRYERGCPPASGAGIRPQWRCTFEPAVKTPAAAQELFALASLLRTREGGPMRAWRAYLRCDPGPLEQIKAHLGGSGIEIGHNDAGEPFITSAVTESLHDLPEAATWAHEQLVYMNAAIRVLFGRSQSFKIQKYEQVMQDGTTRPVAFASGPWTYATVTLRDPEPLPPSDLVHRIAVRGGRDRYFKEAAGRLSRPEHLDWVELYKVYELLRQSAGGSTEFLEHSGWTHTAQKAFTASANRPDVSGDGARHAVMAGDHPQHTMTLPEAVEAMLAALRSFAETP